MPRQLLLPGFPEGSSRIGDALSILNKDGRITYFVGGDNYFSHGVDDACWQRFILASLMDNGHVRACDLEKAPLNIPHRTLMNWLGQLREHGPNSFFRPTRRAGACVMTPEVVAQCEGLLRDGVSVPNVAKRVGIAALTRGNGIGVAEAT